MTVLTSTNVQEYALIFTQTTSSEFESFDTWCDEVPLTQEEVKTLIE